MAFLLAEKPWEEGGKRRIASAEYEGENDLFQERMGQVAGTPTNRASERSSLGAWCHSTGYRDTSPAGHPAVPTPFPVASEVRPRTDTRAIVSGFSMR